MLSHCLAGLWVLLQNRWRLVQLKVLISKKIRVILLFPFISTGS